MDTLDRAPVSPPGRAGGPLGSLLLVLGLAVSSTASGATPPAGTPIDNIAQATDGAAPGTASNPVRAVVQPLESLLLTPGIRDTLPPGAGAVLRHWLFNTSNVTAQVRLELVNVPGDDYDLGLALTHDVNGDGTIDPGDVPIPPGGTVAVAASDSIGLLVAATTPPTIPPLAIALVILIATTLSQNFTAAVTDTLVVPAGTPPEGVLFVVKTVSRSTAEIGDELDYTVRVANRSAAGLALVTVEDALPPGFAYVVPSARRDGVALADPGGDRGPNLAFALGSLGADGVATLRYRVRITAGAPPGPSVNRAWASSAGMRSNVAAARVMVQPGVFADEATIVGTVFVDRDRDRRRGLGDVGVPGVRLYLDDGTFAVTDGDGEYSFYGLSPRTHALKPDPTTLPRARLISLDHRQGDGSQVRFVDLHRGDLRRADFALIPESHPGGPARDSAAADSLLIAEARARVVAPASGPAELARGLRRELPTAPGGVIEGDARARPSSGIADPVAASAIAHGMGPRPADPVGGVDESSELARPPLTLGSADRGTPSTAIPTDSLVASLDASLAFVDFADGDTLRVRQATVRVKGERGFPFELRVNDIPIPPGRVGRRTTMPERGLEAWEYVGVALAPGLNHLTVEQRGADGSVRGRAAVRLIAPDRLARIVLQAPTTAPAGRRHETKVRLRSLDVRGVPVGDRTIVTLETTLGSWGANDLDPALPGLQMALEGGGGEVALISPDEPGAANITVHAYDREAVVPAARLTLTFVPELRPLMLVGAVEGAITLHDLVRGTGGGPRPATGFEQAMSSFATPFASSRGEAGARAALFMKGRLREDVMLTVGWDSDRPDGLRRFRDIQPDAFYPIYGDASLRGYEAQSTGRLYARVDRRGASLLYGDFVTGGAGTGRSLSSYSRSLTGVAQRYENGRLRLESFVSRGNAHRRVDELPGRGISGPYVLGASPVTENSELVEIVTRDRDQPSVVLSAKAQSRFVDYTLEAATGRLLFRAAVPGFDADLNPVSIRVSYEVEQGGPSYWVAGGEARVQLDRRVEVGGSYVDDGDPSLPFGLRSAFAAARLGPATTLEGEYAVRSRDGAADGRGGRLEMRLEGGRAEGRLSVAMTDSAFVNPGSGIGPGRGEAAARFSFRLGAGSRLLADGLYTGEVSGRERRAGLLVALDQGLTNSLRAELGMRLAGGVGSATPDGPTSLALRTRLLAQLPRRPELSGYAELEQDLLSSRRLAALGGEYRYSARGRLYARHELLSSLSSVYALRPGERRLATVLGIDSDVAREAHVFSEYRLADALAGRDAEAAIGLRNGWRFDDWRVGTSLERVNPLSGGDVGPATAVAGSIESTSDDDTKASARMEVRTARASDSFLSTIGLASRLDRSWTALGRAVATATDQRARGVQARVRLQLGLAYRRPDVERWDALARYELHLDREASLPESRSRHSAHVFSVHGDGRSFDRFTTSASWAAKLAREESGGALTRSDAHRIHARLGRDLGRSFDAGVNASALWSDGFRSRREGLGLEVGYSLGPDVWLSAGWNRFGYRDPDLPDETWTDRGIYFRLRAKFDESLLHGWGIAP